eukprot:Gregarina_sp_Poly_1__10532@NODE_776_length_6341_cov_153_345075_g570_i0_p3_GENE_NODE_776_length_6341_cov_153_345075_g570_i0NODE_776_length_6341_cov_153_345075_g570_i0_p3_ORF_typecomplete_len491_score71_81PCI/PF01399_27/1_4e03PCI/PF01399_27/3_7e17TPR_19/PF14559_6/33TPR_19/PF14559_6/1_1TPR_19/PF14559_6/4_4e02FeoC/PF09012_10/4_7e03FeoC/PF09012_10/1_5e03FeoC/PF09012_10/0_25RPN5_C/PF18098_1/5_9e03RPN5_C/PF18098_1/0_071YfiO/PF13525_6/0_17YfiO/PF13525_6/1_8e03TPR_18/PF13512_6/0_11TPR_18/PF13512_6/6_6e03
MTEEGSAILLSELDSLVKDPKLVADFCQDTQQVLGQADALKSAGRLSEAADLIAPLEKKARNAYDGASVSRLWCWLIEAQFEEGKYEAGRETLQSMMKKRGQLKKAMVDAIQLSMKWIDKMPTKEETINLIELLRVITDGKIFVEVERARVMLRLSKMKEEEGDIETASNLLQEVQIETCISIEKIEKANFVLEQMRLVLARNDYIRCQIVSKRINRKLLEAGDFQMIKLRFYSYMILYHMHEEEIADICDCLRSCYNTPIVQNCKENPEAIDMEVLRPFLPPGLQANQLATWYLESMVFFAFLTPQTPEHLDICLRLKELDKKLSQDSPVFKEMLDQFLTNDIVPYPPAYLATLKEHPLLKETPFKNAAGRLEIFKHRTIQHNLRVVAEYYRRITLHRMAQLFDISLEETEDQLCHLVTEGIVQAKINRPVGIVEFNKSEDPSKRLNEWSSSIGRMLDMISMGAVNLQ